MKTYNIFHTCFSKTTLCFILFTGILFPQAGILDNTFSSDGIATTYIGNNQCRIQDIAIQSDGKIVAGGYSYWGVNPIFTLARYNSNGSLDNTFDADGIVNTPLGTDYNVINSIAIQSDGKIVAGGTVMYLGELCFGLARYNADGSLDNNFGIGGAVVTLGLTNSGINSIDIDSNGKIVAGGYSTVSGIINFTVARYNTDGSLDFSFGAGGMTTIAVRPLASESIKSVKVIAGDKIIVGGSSLSDGVTVFALVKLNSDGSPDNTFDSDGKVTTALGSTDDTIFGIEVLSDGKLIAAGYSYTGIHYDFAIAKYNTDGSLDNTFDTDGRLTTQITTSHNGISSIAIQSDDKIVAAGYAYNGANFDFVVARYNSNGTLDNTFSADGIVTTPVGSNDDRALSVAIQNDNKIIAAGYSMIAGFDNFCLVRYLGDPPITVNSPNGGENWIVGSTHDITWTSYGIANIKLEYSTDNGSTWTTITASTPAAAGTYSWTIPNFPSSSVRIRISDVSNSSVFDLSDTVFSISTSLILLTPNGGENWGIHSSHNITWSSSGITNLKLEFTINSGVTWTTIISSTPAAPGTYNWTVPNLLTSGAKIRISDVSVPSKLDTSNACFSISSGHTTGSVILIDDKTTYNGYTITIPVYLELNNSSGIPRYLLSGKLHFDPAKLQFRSVSTETSTLFNQNAWSLGGWQTLPGTIEFYAFGLNNITTSGLLFNLNMKVIDTDPGLTEITSTPAEWISQGINQAVTNVIYGTVHYTLPVSASQIRGDANLDFDVTMDDVTSLIYHLYVNSPLSGQALINADANIDGDVDLYDINAMLWYISFQRWDNIPVFSSSPSSIDFEDVFFSENGVVEISINLLNASQVTAGEIFINYDPEEISFHSYQSESGNVFAYGSQVEEGKSFYVFTRDNINPGNSAGKIIMRFKNGVINPAAKLFTQYRLNNGELKTGPDISFGVTDIKIEEQIPDKFLSSFNYPNPFNPSTTVEYKIPEASFVTIKIFDILGREVKTLISENKTAGTYRVNWNGDNELNEKVGSGTYICRVTCGNNILSFKMLLLK